MQQRELPNQLPAFLARRRRRKIWLKYDLEDSTARWIKLALPWQRAGDYPFFGGVLHAGTTFVIDAVTHDHASSMHPSRRHCGISWKLNLTHGASRWLVGVQLVALREEPGGCAARSKGQVCGVRKGEMFSCEVNKPLSAWGSVDFLPSEVALASRTHQLCG